MEESQTLIWTLPSIVPNEADKAISMTYVPNLCSITHLGECIFPKEPILGWIFAVIAIYLIVRFIKAR